MDEQGVECDVCGGDHQTESCPELGLGGELTEVATVTKARLTVPSNLYIVAIYEGRVNVCANEILQAKTQFGPFEARRTTHNIENEEFFILKILSKDKDGTSICLDTSDENECNWMCLVDVAKTEAEQNCIAYQLGTNIFFNTTKTIIAGTALKVWFASHYAKKMGKSPQPDGVTHSMLGHQLVLQVFQEEPILSSPSLTTSSLPLTSYPALPKIETQQLASPETKTIKTRIIPALYPKGYNITVKQEVVGNDAIEHFFSEVKESLDRGSLDLGVEVVNSVDSSGMLLFKCQRCPMAFEAQSQLAYHIREHIMPNVERKKGKAVYTCKICKVGFQTLSNHNRHMKRHVGYKVKCPQCNYGTYRVDILQTHLMGQHGVSLETAKELAASAEVPQQEVEEDVSKRKPNRRRGRRKKQEIEAQEEDVDSIPEEDTEEEATEQLKEENIKEETYSPGKKAADMAISSVRVQPKRSLKGIRTTGKLKGIKATSLLKRKQADSESEEDHAGPVKIAVSEPVKGKRGRPRKYSLPETKLPRPRGRPRKVRVETQAEENDKEEDSEEEEPEVGEIVSSMVEKAELSQHDQTNTVNESEKSSINTVAVIPLDPLLEGGGDPAGNAYNTTKIETDTPPEVQEVSKEDPDKLSLKEDGKTGTREDDTKEDCKLDTIEDDKIDTIEDGKIDTIEDGNIDTKEDDKTNTKEDDITDTTGESKEQDVEMQDVGEEKKVKLDQDDADNDAPSESEVEKPAPRKRGRPPKVKRLKKSNDLIELEKQIKEVGGAFQCGVCEKKFSQKKYIMLHLPKHSSKFRCDGCDKQFARHESYLNHSCIHHGIGDDIVTADQNGCYSCSECGKVFSKPEYVKRHYSVHSSAWACDKCEKKFSRRHLLLDHVCLDETGEEIYINHECEICKQCFRSLKYLYRHMAMHTDIFKCQGCDKTFSRKDSLQRHVLRCCPDLAEEYKIYDCKNCKRTFATKLGLENHYLNCANYSCEKCRVAYFSLEDLEKHVCAGKVVSDNASVQFQCRECTKTFASINYLRRHEESHNGAFACSLCDKSFSRKEEQKLHEHLCYAQKFLETSEEVECQICNEKFTEAKAYRDHHHEHSHPFKCDRCGKRFIKVGTLTTHSCNEALADEENPYACTICIRSFRTDKNLARHMVMHNKPEHECEYCHKVFYRKDYLNNHVCKLPDGSVVRIVRKKDRIFIKENLVCHLCGRTFVSSSNLNKHMKIHGEKQNQCPHCLKKFHYPAYLREHIKTVHQRAYQFQCSECGKILHSKTGLAAHLKQFHSSEIQLYQCGTCQKTFRQKGNLKTHMYSHTREKNFKCEFCQRAFKYPDQLNRHRLEHTMTEKLGCEFCEKKFCRSYQLKKHIQTFHSGILYVCDICNERCSHKHTIVRHYKRKHPEVSSIFDEQPDYLNSLQHEQGETLTQTELKPDIASIVQAIDQVQTKVVTTDGSGGEEHYTVAEIQTDGDGYLPQVAAEALQNLSNTIIASEGVGGTLTIPHTVEGPDGQQTVVILQIVNPEEEVAIQEIQEIHEVQDIA